MKLNIELNPRTGGLYCIFKHNNKCYFASKVQLPFIGFETMIFHADETGEVSDWLDLYCDRTDKSLEDCINEFIKSL